MFHVELNKIISFTGALLCIFIFNISCGTPRHAVEINNYILLPNGKEILGKEEGLTAFVFENNPRKIPFAQFVANKYNIGSYSDINYWVNTDGYRFKVFLYDNDELNKYFDMGQFMVTKTETEPNTIGTSDKFIGLSVINDANEDCLLEKSLFKNIVLTYLKNLKQEYNNL